MQNEQRNLYVAVIVSGVILLGWQYFFGPKTLPHTPGVAVHTEQGQTPGTTGQAAPTGTPGSIEPTSVELVRDQVKVNVTNDLSLTNFKSNHALYDFNEVVGTHNPLTVWVKTATGMEKILFTMEKTADSFQGKDPVHGIEVRGVIDDQGSLDINLKSPTPQQYIFRMDSTEKKSGQQVRKFIFYTGHNIERVEVGDDKTLDTEVKWFGVDHHYHILSVIFPEKESSYARVSSDGSMVEPVKNETVKKGTALLTLNKAVPELKFRILFSKKGYDELTSMGNNLHLAVDYGFFSIIAVPILRALQFFYKYVMNYGVAIILLTLLIRLITFPLQYKSIKSMKKMQVIQPELNKLREKFKDDPQRMQKESMELFKRAGANPLSGCLPLILQMPIFFAFYAVLGQSIELVNAPFFGWIHDLSVKDPFYVLPVLMSLAMFFQQRMTPTPSADPQQKKIMMFMPIIFGIFMLNLPSGLTLYILVSTLFGILQQVILTRKA